MRNTVAVVGFILFLIAVITVVYGYIAVIEPPFFYIFSLSSIVVSVTALFWQPRTLALSTIAVGTILTLLILVTSNSL